MKPRWRKVFLDLIDNKLRTVLVVLSIAVGVLSVGVIAGAYVIISNDMSASYAANQPANIELRMADFDEDVLAAVHNMRGIDDAEGRRVFNIRVRTADSNQWKTLDIVAMKDFDENKINLLTPMEGASKPAKREIILEKEALENLAVKVGDQLIL